MRAWHCSTSAPSYHIAASGFILNAGRPRPHGDLAAVQSEQWRFRVDRDRGESGWLGTAVCHDRSDPDPRGDRAGRPTGGRAIAPARLRRAPQARRARGWLRRSRARHSRPRRWFTRPTSAWSTPKVTAVGTAAATSSPPRLRPCAGSSSMGPGAEQPEAGRGAGPARAGQRRDHRLGW